MPEFQIEMFWKCLACNEFVKGRYTECTKCGKPKNEKTEYLMPEDLDNAKAIDDENLIKLAKDKPNWNCIYCGSDQRNSNNECIQCGANKKEKTKSPEIIIEKEEPKPQIKEEQNKVEKSYSKKIGIVLAGFCLIGGFAYINKPIEAQAVSFSWKSEIVIDKHVLEEQSGFDYPNDAIELKDQGKRVAGSVNVFDHYDKQEYEVEEIVSYKDEKYSDTEVCGKDCITIPKTCKKIEPVCKLVDTNCSDVKVNCKKTPVTCKSNKNGFANCTGGDNICDTKTICKDKKKECTKETQVCEEEKKKCTDKICNVIKTKKVPVKAKVKKTRDVPIYRTDPVYKTFFTWKHWEWRFSRKEIISGSDKNPSIENKYSLLEKEKVRNIDSTYNVLFKNKQNTFNYYTNSIDSFKSIQPNKTYNIVVIGDKVINIK